MGSWSPSSPPQASTPRPQLLTTISRGSPGAALLAWPLSRLLVLWALHPLAAQSTMLGAEPLRRVGGLGRWRPFLQAGAWGHRASLPPPCNYSAPGPTGDMPVEVGQVLLSSHSLQMGIESPPCFRRSLVPRVEGPALTAYALQRVSAPHALPSPEHLPCQAVPGRALQVTGQPWWKGLGLQFG